MTKNSTPDPRVVYAEIIDLPHWESPTRPRMSRYNRAAQFSPFAALTGYDDIIREEARETGVWTEPGESRKEEINRRLNGIAEALAGRQKPAARVTRFIPDAKKDGGAYAAAEGLVRKIDPIQRKLVLSAGNNQLLEIDFDRITAIDPL